MDSRYREEGGGVVRAVNHGKNNHNDGLDPIGPKASDQYHIENGQEEDYCSAANVCSKVCTCLP